MRVLFVVPYVPNLIRVRPYHFIGSLLRRGHDVTVATVWTTDAERADMELLAGAGARVLAEHMPASHSLRNSVLALPSQAPLQSVYSWRPALFARLVDAVTAGEFDAVHVEHLRGSRYGLEIQQALAKTAGSASTTPVVWDSVDCISYLFEQASRNSRSLKGRLITTLELGRTQRYEAALIERFDRTLVTSPVDKAALVELYARYGRPATNNGASPPPIDPSDQIEVVPNGVDLENFRFTNLVDRMPNRIVFSGKMSYHANVTAALHLVRDIMPHVWAQRPDVEVCIVGKDPSAEVQALATGNAAGEPCRERQVIVTGSVPDLNTYVQGAAVAAAPLLYGAGIQNKVLEAMACGTPVVATPQASVALTAVPGRDLLVAAEPAKFAAAMLELLASPLRRDQVGRGGRAYVEANHTWPGAAARLEEIYTSCAKRKRTERIQH